MSRKLEQYQEMRDFRRTPEPKGDSSSRDERSELPFFVIQKHAASNLHYDFRLEIDDVLKSWAVPKGPSYDPETKRLAMMTEDHPMEYGAFEGVIPAGNYGAGNVIIWDHGEWEYLEPGDDPSAGLAKGKLTFVLHGRKMFGEWTLVRIKGRRSGKGNEWLLFKHRDQWANDEVDVTEVAPLSVVSGRPVDELGSADETWTSNRESGKRRAGSNAEKGAKSATSKKRRKQATSTTEKSR